VAARQEIDAVRRGRPPWQARATIASIKRLLRPILDLRHDLAFIDRRRRRSRADRRRTRGGRKVLIASFARTKRSRIEAAGVLIFALSPSSLLR
jgi:hypothetical protein